MLKETIGHFLQRQSHVFEADFLTNDIARHVREAIMHGAHYSRKHRAIADAGIEHANRWWSRMQIGEFLGDAMRHFPFFTAGIDEEQILLAVIEEAEIALRIV